MAAEATEQQQKKALNQAADLGKVSGNFVSMDAEELQCALDNDMIVVSPYERNYGKMGGKIFPITYKGKNIALNLGNYENGVGFPFGASDTYNERIERNQQQSLGGMNMPPGMGFQMGGGVSVGWGQTPPTQEAVVSDKVRSLQIEFTSGSAEANVLANMDVFLRKQVLLHNQQWLKLPNDHENIVTEGNIRKSMNCALKTATKDGKPMRAPCIYTNVYNKLSVQKHKPGNINPATGRKIHKRGTIDDIKPRSSGKVVLEIRGVYYVSEKFGIKYEVKTVVVFEGSDSDEALLRDDDVEIEEDNDVGGGGCEDVEEDEEEEEQQQQSKFNSSSPSGEKRKRAAAGGDYSSDEFAHPVSKQPRISDSTAPMMVTPGQFF